MEWHLRGMNVGEWLVRSIHLLFTMGKTISLSFPGGIAISAKGSSQKPPARLHLAVRRWGFASAESTKPRWHSMWTFWEQFACSRNTWVTDSTITEHSGTFHFPLLWTLPTKTFPLNQRLARLTSLTHPLRTSWAGCRLSSVRHRHQHRDSISLQQEGKHSCWS